METTRYFFDSCITVNSKVTAMQFAINKATHWNGERYEVNTKQAAIIYAMFKDNMELPDTAATENNPFNK